MIDYSLYLCTNSEINSNYPIEECVRQAIIGGVTFVQVREKDKTLEEFIDIARKIKKVTDAYNVPLVINDSIEIAIAIDAAGVHLGQDDISCKKARKILGKNKIIGISVTTLKEAERAIEDGADYLGVGAIYNTETKKDAKLVSKESLKKICENSRIPIVVIGGINEKTILKLKGLKISGYAMISPILKSENIINSTRKIKNIINKKVWLI